MPVATVKSSYFQFMRIYYTTLSFQKVFTVLTWVTTGWLDPPGCCTFYRNHKNIYEILAWSLVIAVKRQEMAGIFFVFYP